MKAEELAEELADFWLSAFVSADWVERKSLLDDVLAQLKADLDPSEDYEAVSQCFIAALVQRLGEGAVEGAAQAGIYALSRSARHREAAMAWALAAGWRSEVPVPRSPPSERRRFARKPANAVSEMWFSGGATPCRVTDLSEAGARVLVPELAPPPGTRVRIAVPDSGIRDAMVVFRGDAGLGLRFSDVPG